METAESTKLEGAPHMFRTAAFEGPLDLLLFLIQKSEINIYDIPISNITEQFLAYLHSSEASQLNLGDLSDFYKMAADLLYIKSRMLLPVEVDFDEEYEDPRQELVNRLLDYQKFKQYTKLLEEGAADDQIYIERKPTDFMIPFDDQELFEGVDLDLLRSVFSNIISNKNITKVFNVFEEVTVNEKLTLMMELFEKKTEINFLEVIVHPDRPMHVICAFMAILEGCKFRMITIRQEKQFGPILIRKRKEETISDEEADEIDEMYEKAIEKGYYKEQEILHDEDGDDFSIHREDESLPDKPIVPAEATADKKTGREIEGEREDLVGIGDFEEISLDEDESDDKEDD